MPVSRLSVISVISAVCFPIALNGCGNGNPVVPPLGFATLTIEATEIVAYPPDYSYDAQVAVNPVTGEIYCCWCRKTGDAPEVYWRRGVPGAFSAEEAITEVDGIRSWNPSICAGPDGRVHFAYMDQKPVGGRKEIYAKSWVGAAWGPEERLSIMNIWTGWDPVVDVYPDGRPVVCWFDHGYGVQHEILLRIGDGEGFWWPIVRLTDDDHWQYFPDIEIDSTGVLHLTYVDSRFQLDEWGDGNHHEEGKNLEVYYRTWDGASPGPEVRLSESPLRSDASQVAVDAGGNAHVIFVDESAYGYYRLYYRRVQTGVPGELIPLSSSVRRSDLSAIDCLGDRIFVAYPEYLDPEGLSTSRANLYLREILYDGQLGSPIALASSGTNIHPRMVADPERDMLWILWMEYTGDDVKLIDGESRIHLSGVGVGT